MTPNIFLIITTFLCALITVQAHSCLLEPRGDFSSIRKPECRLGGPPHTRSGTCEGPCITKTSWRYEQGPRKHYRRGTFAKIAWARNNHRGGFVRLSLVPLEQRMNRSAHAAMAFRYSCFEAEAVVCNKDECGTDESGLRYQTTVQIPTVYQDGVYVLAWSWYGGTVRKSSYFGTYWSCTEVVIEGGPKTADYQPIFRPGSTVERRGSGKGETCFAAAQDVGTCPREPCTSITGSFTKPKPFQGGGQPARIRGDWRRHPTLRADPTVAVMPVMAPTPAFMEVMPIVTPSPAFMDVQASVLPTPDP